MGCRGPHGSPRARLGRWRTVQTRRWSRGRSSSSTRRAAAAGPCDQPSHNVMSAGFTRGDASQVRKGCACVAVLWLGGCAAVGSHDVPERPCSSMKNDRRCSRRSLMPLHCGRRRCPRTRTWCGLCLRIMPLVTGGWSGDAGASARRSGEGERMRSLRPAFFISGSLRSRRRRTTSMNRESPSAPRLNPSGAFKLWRSNSRPSRLA